MDPHEASQEQPLADRSFDPAPESDSSNLETELSRTPTLGVSGSEEKSDENGRSIEVPFENLAPQQVSFERRTSIITYLILGVVALIVCFPVGVYFGNWWGWVLLGAGWLALNVVLILVALWWPPKSYRNRSWRMTEDGMEIRNGVWWKHRIAIPVARVQHVDVSQGPVQRMFDLSTLVVHTAGTRNASVSLEGLTYGKAMEVRDALIAQKEALDVT